jgi:Phage P22-like portal protein
MPDKEDLPRIARQCWHQYLQATEKSREEEKESAGFYVGGELQWRKSELRKREGRQRPWMTLNRCKPVVDQVENEARQNPPGPRAHPVGNGADKDGADILEGLIREYEYRSNAQGAYITALRTACARMRGAFELGTEYVSDDSFEQQLVIKEIANPELVFYDPMSEKASREDAMWQGKIRILTREQVIEQYGQNLKILNPSMVDQFASWMSDVAGPGLMGMNRSTISAWTGGSRSEGPYYICEFWRVEIEEVKLTLYDDHIAYFEDDTIPPNVKPKLNDKGKRMERTVGRRRVMKYLLTALDKIRETVWPGEQIPIFWVMGPEMWIEGQCHRHSLISPALDAQRGLNFAATSAAEMVGSMNKTAFIGYVGQFNVENAQGINPWLNQNGAVWPFMEVKPVFANDPVTGQQHLLPLPQRNAWEAPIQRILELCTFFAEQIKAATSVFFEPSLPSARSAQSGRAIQALQQQTNIGTLNWQDNLHRAVGLSYQEAARVMRKLYDSQRVRTIVRADSSHELAEINVEFPNDSSTGNKKRNNIKDGAYSIRVTAGPNFQTRQEKSIELLTEVFKIIPQLLSMPMIASQFLRMVGQGDPQIEQMADALNPQQGSDDPMQMQAQLVKLTAENQQLQQVMQTLHAQIESKLPQIDAQKWIATLNNLAKIRVAEITASKDADNANADREAQLLDSKLDMAHDVALQAAQHEHEVQQQESQQTAQAASQVSAQDAQAQQQQQSQANQGE